MKELLFVTGNKFKLLSAKSYAAPFNLTISGVDINCPEIQANTIEEVAIFSSQYASNELKADTFKNDSGVIIPYLNGFPGPYTKYVSDTLGQNGILNLMSNVKDRYACFVECYALTEYGVGTKVFFSRTEGRIAEQAQGDDSTVWNRIFIPNGFEYPLACYSEEERVEMWDKTGMIELAKYYVGK